MVTRFEALVKDIAQVALPAQNLLLLRKDQL